MGRPGVTILQLDTQFPRIPGDVACPDTYACEVEIIRVPRASVGRIVTAEPERIDIAPFATALKAARGDVIVTSCGFLSYWQGHLAGLSARRVITSSLVALERLSGEVAPENLLILTFDAEAIGPKHLHGRAEYLSSLRGLPEGSHLRKVIAGDLAELDETRANREFREWIKDILRPEHTHVLLECTNLPPYKSRLGPGVVITDILTEIERVRPNSIRRIFL